MLSSVDTSALNNNTEKKEHSLTQPTYTPVLNTPPLNQPNPLLSTTARLIITATSKDQTNALQLPENPCSPCAKPENRPSSVTSNGVYTLKRSRSDPIHGENPKPRTLAPGLV